MRARAIHRGPVSPAGTSVVATLLAGAMIGSAATASIPFDPRYVLGGIAAAVPVGLALAGLAVVRPQVSMLALIELVAFAALLLTEAAVGRAPDPLVAAALATVTVGAVAMVGRRALLHDVLIALVVGYLGAALIYEVGIPLHNLL